ncbi:MAG: arylsulfatase [Acidobacteriota bacterium]
MLRRRFGWSFLFFVGLVFLACGGLEETAEEPPWNVVLILADDLGYGDLGCYGQERIRTPNIDRLAAEGLRFTRFYAGSTVCAPSRCSLMTGLHTGHAVVRGNYEVQPMGQYPLSDEALTVAEVFQSQGYRTGLIGKWGLGGPGSTGEPNRQGFEYCFGYLCQRHAHNYYPEFLFRNGERVPLPGNRVAEPRSDGAGVAVERAVYAPDLFEEEVDRFLRDPDPRPFFLYFASPFPHANNEAGDRGMEVPDYGPYAAEDWPEAQKGYAAMVSRLDRAVGRILATLRKTGRDRHTLVLFSSDNGPHREGGFDPHFFNSTGGLRGIKRDLYEGGIRVPFIAWAPDLIPGGGETDQPGAFWDLLPTLAELIGAEVSLPLDGISLLPVLRGESLPTRRPLYWEFKGKQAVAYERWKAVRLGLDSPLELYDLAADPGESRNLAAERPEILAEAERLLQAEHTPSAIFPLFPGESAPVVSGETEASGEQSAGSPPTPSRVLPVAGCAQGPLATQTKPLVMTLRCVAPPGGLS